MLTKKDVEALAVLARIDLSDTEKEAIVPKLDSILAYVGEVAKVVTEDLPARVGVVKNVLRNDEKPNEGGMYSKDMLENAPAIEGEYVKVKQMF